MSLHTFGYIRDLPDHRDQLLVAPPSALPASVDLRPNCPPIYDQGQLGSCTANAIAGAMEFDQMKQGLSVFMPSRLFVYYNERVLEHTVLSDSGASLRDGMKTIKRQGVCPETDWPYDISQFTVQPPASCYQVALQNTALSYSRVFQSLTQLKSVLAQGLPIVFGFTVYESFETPEVAATGIVPLPSTWESVLGGHAVVAVGYDDSTQRFTCRNSWSDQWGDKGYFYMPYAYLTDRQLASDFWVVRTVQ